MSRYFLKAGEPCGRYFLQHKEYVMMTTITDNDYIIDDIILTEPAFQVIGGVGL